MNNQHPHIGKKLLTARVLRAALEQPITRSDAPSGLLRGWLDYLLARKSQRLPRAINIDGTRYEWDGAEYVAAGRAQHTDDEVQIFDTRAQMVAPLN